MNPMDNPIAFAANLFLSHEQELRDKHGPNALYVRPQVWGSPGQTMVVAGWAYLDGSPAIALGVEQLLVLTFEDSSGELQRYPRQPTKVYALLAPYMENHAQPVPHLTFRIPESEKPRLREAIKNLPEHSPKGNTGGAVSRFNAPLEPEPITAFDRLKENMFMLIVFGVPILFVLGFCGLSLTNSSLGGQVMELFGDKKDPRTEFVLGAYKGSDANGPEQLKYASYLLKGVQTDGTGKVMVETKPLSKKARKKVNKALTKKGLAKVEKEHFIEYDPGYNRYDSAWQLTQVLDTGFQNALGDDVLNLLSPYYKGDSAGPQSDPDRPQIVVTSKVKPVGEGWDYRKEKVARLHFTYKVKLKNKGQKSKSFKIEIEPAYTLPKDGSKHPYLVQKRRADKLMRTKVAARFFAPESAAMKRINELHAP